MLFRSFGFPIVLSLIFIAMFSNLEKAFKATPMSFGVVQDEAYRSAPGLDALVERVSAADVDPRLIAKVAHSTASEAEAAAKRGDTAGYLAVENGGPVLHVTREGDDEPSLRVLRVVMDSYVQTRAQREAAIAAGAAPEQVAELQAAHGFTRPVAVTRTPAQ